MNRLKIKFLKCQLIMTVITAAFIVCTQINITKADELPPADTEVTTEENTGLNPADDGTTQEDDTGIWGVFSGVFDFIKGIIIPGDDFFSNEFNNLNEKLQSKLPSSIYIDTIGRFKDVQDAFSEESSPIDNELVYEGTPINVNVKSLIIPFIDKFRPIITGLYVFYLAFYNYRQILFLIRGTNYKNMHVKT